MILFIKHAKTEGPGTLESFFKKAFGDTRTVELLDNGKLPSINDCEAIICLGGPMNVYETEKYQFLKVEESFLSDALKKNIPILGICLGAQLLAKVSGARIIKAENKEIGWYNINLTEEGKADQFFKGLGENLEIFQWHEDSFCVPDTGVLLATSNTCKNQAIRIGKCAWALQFHPEMTKEMIDCWAKNEKDSDRNKMLNGYLAKKNVYDNQSKIMFSNFSKMIVG